MGDQLLRGGCSVTPRHRIWRIVQFYLLIYAFLYAANVYLDWYSPVYKHARWDWLLVIPVTLPFCTAVRKWQDRRDARALAKKINKLEGDD
jgi:hypothetical protein